MWNIHVIKIRRSLVVNTFQGVCCMRIVYQTLRKLDLLIGQEKITSFTSLNELNLKYDSLKKRWFGTIYVSKQFKQIKTSNKNGIM